MRAALAAAVLSVSLLLAACGDDEQPPPTTEVATTEVPEGIYFDGDPCTLVTREDAVALLGVPVTRDQYHAYDIAFCFWDAPDQGVNVSVEQFESGDAAAARLADRDPGQDGHPIDGLGEEAWRRPLPPPGHDPGGQIVVREGPYLVTVTVLREHLGEDELEALAQTAIDRLPPS